MEFESAHAYISCASDLRETIKRLDDVIKALLLVAVKAAEKDYISEYDFNDGQVKIKTAYRGASAVSKSIEDFRKIKKQYEAEYNNNKFGRVTRMIDSKTFRRGR